MTNEHERMVEEMPTNICVVCGGDGYTVEHDPRDHTGQTPMQVQCDFCHAEGKIATLDTVRTTLSTLITKVREQHLREDIDRLEGMKKKKDTPKSLYRHDGTVEPIMTYSNDSDHAYNGALDTLIHQKQEELQTLTSEV